MSAIDRLRATGENLPARLRKEILALGSSAVPALVDILVDEQLGLADTPAQGWPPIHAVGLLADLKAAEAIEPMLDVLAETEFDEIINSELSERLPEFGSSVLEPALARLEAAQGDGALAIVSVLAQLGIRDERIFAVILQAFNEDLVLGAMFLADYGDPRALPLIEAAIAAFEPDLSNATWRHDLTELIEAHRALGGTLTDDLKVRIDALNRATTQRSSSSHPSRSNKVGRNEPCPCGSGKKYKKCCLGKAPVATLPG